jgi:hypothetical protein
LERVFHRLGAEADVHSHHQMTARWQNCAKQEYGDEFPKVFYYKKNGAYFVKVKACDIAKQYQWLKNITDDMDTESLML